MTTPDDQNPPSGGYEPPPIEKAPPPPPSLPPPPMQSSSGPRVGPPPPPAYPHLPPPPPRYEPPPGALTRAAWSNLWVSVFCFFSGFLCGLGLPLSILALRASFKSLGQAKEYNNSRAQSIARAAIVVGFLGLASGLFGFYDFWFKF